MKESGSGVRGPGSGFDLGLTLYPRLIHFFIRGLYATLRVRHAHAGHIEELNRAGKHYVLAFWHEQLMLMFFSRHRKPITVMSSMHRDGEISARTQERFGAHVIRGSSSRGGSNALRQMIKTGDLGQSLVFTPDGPRGPRRVAQMGVVVASQATGSPVLPVACIAKKKRFCGRGTGFRFPGLFRESSFSTASRSRSPASSPGRRWRDAVSKSSAGSTS